MSENDKILDKEFAISTLGEKETYLNMISDFNSLTLNPCLENLKNAIEEKDNKKVRDGAHTLKGSSTYIGAKRLSNISKEIQFAFDNKNIELGYNLYPKLLEVSILTKIYIRKDLQTEGMDAKETEDCDLIVPIADGYEIISEDKTNIKVILKENRQPKSETVNLENNPKNRKSISNLDNLEDNSLDKFKSKDSINKNNIDLRNNNHKEIEQKNDQEIKLSSSPDQNFDNVKENYQEKKENKHSKLDFHRLEENPIQSSMQRKVASHLKIKEGDLEIQKSVKEEGREEYNGLPINDKNMSEIIEDDKVISNNKSKKVIYQPSEEYNGLPINEKMPYNDFENNKNNFVQTDKDRENSNNRENNMKEKIISEKVNKEVDEEKENTKKKDKRTKKNQNSNSEEETERCSCGCNII